MRIRELMRLFTVGIVNSTRNVLRRSSHDCDHGKGSAHTMLILIYCMCPWNEVIGV